MDLPTGTVTFLFTDIEGSTRLLQELGDGYRRVQDDHNAIVRRAVAAGDGVEIRSEGDSFFVVFGSAKKAVDAVVAAQLGLSGHPWPEGVALKVRAGLHTGEGVLGGDDYIGLDVNRAARIAAAAYGGQVLLSEATRTLVSAVLPEGALLLDRGLHRLKDLAYPEHLYQLDIEGLPSESRPPRSLEARPHNLPVQLTSFVGREREVAELRDRLKGGGLITLSGPGGTGKTRMAIQAAAETLLDFADGAVFVDLAAVSDPALVGSAIASALGVWEKVGQPLVETLMDHFHDKQLLVVLDNFEQVLDAAGDVDRLVKAAPRCTFLVTSRSPLHLYGEREIPLQPLSLPDLRSLPDPIWLRGFEAVGLFVDRASSARAGFELDESNAPIVAEICARLDGLPLAIELAASRIKVLSAEEIRNRLNNRLPLLVSPARNVPERQRTLRAAIAWSHDVLDAAERRLFARLSVFAGGGTLEAVDAVGNPSGDLGTDTLAALSSLVDQSLIRHSEIEGESRYGMLETIREFATERLMTDWDADDTARRHAEFFLRVSEDAEGQFTREDQATWLSRFEREHDNVRAALRWSIQSGEAEPGLRIAAAVWRFWQHRGHLTEGRQWLRELLAMPTAEGSSVARARALGAAGSLAYWQSDVKEMERLYEQGLSAARRVGDPVAEYDAIYNLVFVPVSKGDLETAARVGKEVLAKARQLGDKHRLSEALGTVAYVCFMRGEYEAALPLNEEAIALARETGNRFSLAESVETVGQIHRMLGNFEASRAAYLEALTLKKEGGNVAGLLTTLFMVSALESAQGHHQRAARLFGAASEMEQEVAGAPSTVSLFIGDPLGAARRAIGDAATDRALEEGRAMDSNAAAAYAQEQDRGRDQASIE
jgi:predicted ATPase/class 3 adenylate cyclase